MGKIHARGAVPAARQSYQAYVSVYCTVEMLGKSVRVQGAVGTSWGSGSILPEWESFLPTMVSVLQQEDTMITDCGYLAAKSQGRMRWEKLSPGSGPDLNC